MKTVRTRCLPQSKIKCRVSQHPLPHQHLNQHRSMKLEPVESTPSTQVEPPSAQVQPAVNAGRAAISAGSATFGSGRAAINAGSAAVNAGPAAVNAGSATVNTGPAAGRRLRGPSSHGSSRPRARHSLPLHKAAVEVLAESLRREEGSARRSPTLGPVLLVSEIKLYNEEVIEGRPQGGQYLRAPEKRISTARAKCTRSGSIPGSKAKDDYFHQELVQRPRRRRSNLARNVISEENVAPLKRRSPL